MLIFDVTAADRLILDPSASDFLILTTAQLEAFVAAWAANHSQVIWGG